MNKARKNIKERKNIPCREPEKDQCGWTGREGKDGSLRDPDYAESCADQKEYDLYLKSLKKAAVRLTEKFIKHLSRDLGRHCRKILGSTWKTALKQLPSTGECPWPGARGRALRHLAHNAVCQLVIACSPLPFHEAHYVLNKTHQIL